jgi:LCP family protein required for cell wall assembly
MGAFAPCMRHASLMLQHAGRARRGARSRHRAPTPARLRRARTLRGAVGVTLLGAVLPGSGLLWTGRLLGYVLLVPTVAGGIWFLAAMPDAHALLQLAVDPARLRTTATVVGICFAVWAMTLLATYFCARPQGLRRTPTILGAVLVTLACAAVAVPVVQSMRIATTQADLVDTVFTHNVTATAPRDVTPEVPWGGRARLNILLLGGDGGVGRTGIRTDTVMLLSIDTHTGKTVVFSLPRNMMYAHFTPGSPLAAKFPDGFTGTGDPSFWMLNAIYGQVPALYPDILGRSTNEGADALKLAVGGSLGLDVDYYVLVNLLGFQKVVDAMGGVTVNINEPVAINGDTDRHIPPTGYLQPGPNQHLDGFHALWFARGRWGSDDYQRMLRQRCVVDALIQQADPVTLVRRYLDLADATKDIVRTDIPRSLLPALVDLGLEVKQHRVRSIAFVSSDRFFSGNPDYTWIQDSVRRALAPVGKHHAHQPDDPGRAVDVANSCAYHPVS